MDNFLVNASEKINLKNDKKLIIETSNENIDKLNKLIQKTYANIDLTNTELVLQTKLSQRILSKEGDLYLRTQGTQVKQVKLGNHTFKAIKITSGKGKYLTELATLQSEGMSVVAKYFKLIKYKPKLK